MRKVAIVFTVLTLLGAAIAYVLLIGWGNYKPSTHFSVRAHIVGQ